MHRLRKGLRFVAGLFLLAGTPVAAAADEYYLEPAAFLEAAFAGEPPEASLLWLTGERGEVAAEILGHKAPSLRVRYWHKADRTAWILEEVGREKPITAGFVIEKGKLADVRVLAFRESRGWEIRHDFFTKQFNGVELENGRSLSKSIDNITGATLSVNAMKRMASLALFLDGETPDVTP